MKLPEAIEEGLQAATYLPHAGQGCEYADPHSGWVYVDDVRELIAEALDQERRIAAYVMDRECTEAGADQAIEILRQRIGRERRG